MERAPPAEAESAGGAGSPKGSKAGAGHDEAGIASKSKPQLEKLVRQLTSRVKDRERQLRDVQRKQQEQLVSVSIKVAGPPADEADEHRLRQLEEERDNALSQLEHTKKRLSSALKKKHSELCDAQARAQSLEQQLHHGSDAADVADDPTTGDSASSEDRHAENAKRHSECINQLQQRDARIEELQQQLSASSRSHEDSHAASASADIQEELDEVRFELERNQRALSEAKQTVAQREQRIEQLEDEKEKAVANAKKTSMAEVTKLQQSLEQKDTELSSMSSKLTTTETDLQEKNRKLSTMESEASGEREKLARELQNAKAEAQHREHKLESDKEALEQRALAAEDREAQAERARQDAEASLADERSHIASEKERMSARIEQLESDADDATERENQLRQELNQYKNRAQALLKQRDEELAKAKGTGSKEKEEQAKKEVEDAKAERDQALQAMEEADMEHKAEVQRLQNAIEQAQQEKADAVASKEQERRAAQIELHQLKNDAATATDGSVPESRRSSSSYDAACSINAETDVKRLQQAKEQAEQRAASVEKEFAEYRQMANRMAESKDEELTKLLNKLNELREQRAPEREEQADLAQQVTNVDRSNAASVAATTAHREIEESHDTSSKLREQVKLVQQKDEQLSAAAHRIERLESDIDELERDNERHAEQEWALKQEIKSMHREDKREETTTHASEYLKNVILQLYETQEMEPILDVLSTLLQFSEDEYERCRRKLHEPSSGGAYLSRLVGFR